MLGVPLLFDLNTNNKLDTYFIQRYFNEFIIFADLPLPISDISDEKYHEKDIIPVIPHSNVETLLRIIKETDAEFKEKEQKLIDEFERKKKEVNIKEMERELKKQKRDQEKLRKENEKAEKKREKLEKESILKKEKEEKRNKKLMDAKLKQENLIEDQRLKKDSLAADINESEVDSRTKARIDKEKQLALAKEMSHYRITPEIEEEPTYEVDGKISCGSFKMNVLCFKHLPQSKRETTESHTTSYRFKESISYRS